MKVFLYIVIGFIAMAAAALAIAAVKAPASHFIMLFFFVVLFAVPPVGAFWMMYMSVRYEKRPLAMVLLALIPFTFLWYYFERVRSGKLPRAHDFASRRA